MTNRIILSTDDRVWIRDLPVWPMHVAKSGLRSTAILLSNRGISVRRYKKMGGSLSRLRYMIRNEAVVVH